MEIVCSLEGNCVLCTAESWAGWCICDIKMLKNFNKDSCKRPAYGKNPGEKISEIFTVRKLEK